MTDSKKLLLEKRITQVVKDNVHERARHIIRKSDSLMAVLVEAESHDVTFYKIVVPLKNEYFRVPLFTKNGKDHAILCGQLLGEAYIDRLNLDISYLDNPASISTPAICKEYFAMNAKLMPVYKG
jgi:hypothetical protein